MQEQTIRTNWQGYTDGWSDMDQARRVELINASVSENIDYSNPQLIGHGRAALIEAMLQFQQQFPGAHFEIETFIVHHNQLLSSWTLRGKDGSALLTGHNYAQADCDGKIIHTAGFFAT